MGTSIEDNNINSSKNSDIDTSVNKDRLKEEELILDIAKSRYENALSRWASLDNKASNLIGYVTIVTGLLIGIGTIDLFEKIDSAISFILFFGGLGFLILTIIFSLITIKLKKYAITPSLEDLQRIFDDTRFEYRTIIRQIIISILPALKKLEETNSNKAVWLGWSWYFLVTAIMFMFIFLFEFILN